MALILYIESATEVCAVALAENGRLISEKYSTEPRHHAQLLTVYFEQLMAESGYNFDELDAICVSKGPGSYTGLRIGVAVAKGLCFALDKPLIAINTLFSMAVCLKDQGLEKWMEDQENLLFCPMIDARRMEVYTAIYDFELREQSPVKALVLADDSFVEYRNHRLVFFGDGAFKLKNIINPTLKAEFANEFQFTAAGMIAEGYQRFIKQQFEDVAYFEPFYLKEFIGKKGN